MLLEPEREEFDLRFCRYLLKRTNMPILGVCGGMQLLNIALGGNLHQDIDEAFPGLGINHRQTDKPMAVRHPVQFRSGSKLAKIYGRLKVETVSSHHQVVNELGEGLVAEGFSADGFIEGFSHSRKHFVVGVQYHPEQDIKPHLRLFRALIKAGKVVA